MGFTWTWITWLALGLILVTWLADGWLEWLNRRHVRKYAHAVPESFSGFIDEASYRKSVEYTLAKSRFGLVETAVGKGVLLLALFSGPLPLVYAHFSLWLGSSAWASAAFLVCLGLVLSLPELPLDWHAQFKLEAKFGFNTTTPQIWWRDRLKGWGLGLALGYPLLLLVLKCVDWAGEQWWFWAWLTVAGFQLVLMEVAPVLILPLFNQFKPLPDGSLRSRLLALADRTGFRARDIQVMDGSRRSTHSNAFFTGLGRWRRIVLYDTLVEQLTEPELEAVLAHEIGHFKLRHIPFMLVVSFAGLLAGFYGLAWLVGQAGFVEAFGFSHQALAPALLIVSLIGGSLMFWLSPLVHFFSRRFEYQADRFAARALGETRSLRDALRKLNLKNLSNLTPHPIYSGFHYSHPALLEREKALLKSQPMATIPQ
jgi:STE24 endopeptidase